MKLHESGMLEVTPGFSNIETEDCDDEDGLFECNETLEIRNTKGSILTTFTFVTTRGTFYQYALEWLGFLGDSNDLENLALCEMDEHYRLASQKRQIVLSKMNDTNIIDNLASRMGEGLIQIVLVSANGFRPHLPRSRLHIEYEVMIPNEKSLISRTNFVQLPLQSHKQFYNAIFILIVILELVSVLYFQTNKINAM